jgi:mRNA interferase MazF
MHHTLYAERDSMIMRGDLFSACLDPVVGSEQGGIRPVLVVQNNVGNRYSPTVIVLAITGQINKTRLPTHVPVAALGTGLQKDSIILAEQIRTLDKRRLREKIGVLQPDVMQKVSEAMMISLGFPTN